MDQDGAVLHGSILFACKFELSVVQANIYSR